MANGFEVNISEREFKAKSADDQSWILFQGVSSLHKEGCLWGQKKYKSDRIKILSAMAGSVAFAFGIIYIIYQMTCK
jgi:hypothetical protein